ncbi:hypothetical protein A2Z53_00790 [Candidatus Giovannonibacteria bacterium RIFCSPHIGHO2_02_42_15]|uniref:Uncharacterized protein n=1 Tax=Candidatus Giovannonibacteria bacterium RIFCSPHIGHO2_02_42_15 TaxID=1798329 RepID=A0A1F5VLM8_9BACT|nr:MAG: hypothetical protein A2Z53_00790 [Candidatus Giovannonibacteria bacterium RIFCSPHIGHO2_02_42_15]
MLYNITYYFLNPDTTRCGGPGYDLVRALGKVGVSVGTNGCTTKNEVLACGCKWASTRFEREKAGMSPNVYSHPYVFRPCQAHEPVATRIGVLFPESGRECDAGRWISPI